MINIKKPLSLLLAALLLLPFAVAARAKDPAPKKFLVLGDSIAAGSGVYINKERRAYANLVAAAKGYDLTNYGAGGDTSAHLLEKVARQDNTRRAVRQADIIAVSIGGNDLMHAQDFAALVIEGLLGDYTQMEPILASYRENFAGIVKGIRALNPEALLIVQTLYNPAFPLPSLREAYGTAIQGINAAIRDYLAAHPGAFVIAAVLLAAIDKAEPRLPSPIWPLDALLWLCKPLLALLDKVLIGGALRMGYGIFKAVG
ncbi:MAG: GDSL-type esterase/lipase family protein [Firmicutes bacterium]|nr:GDSL-type esterase/lipase family protein [Bacillota bacterium]